MSGPNSGSSGEAEVPMKPPWRARRSRGERCVSPNVDADEIVGHVHHVDIREALDVGVAVYRARFCAMMVLISRIVALPSNAPPAV